MHSINEGFGPMPKGDRQDTLQQLSLTALRAALPTSKFLFRDERVDDKGVDGALEAKLNDCFLNCRASSNSNQQIPRKQTWTDRCLAVSPPAS